MLIMLLSMSLHRSTIKMSVMQLFLRYNSSPTKSSCPFIPKYLKNYQIYQIQKGHNNHKFTYLMTRILLLICFFIALSTSDLTQQQSQPLGCYIKNCELCDLSGFVCLFCPSNTDCCSYNCTLCANSTTCLQCDDNFTLEYNICVPNDTCSSQQSLCTNCSNQTCQACIPGYWLANVSLCLSCVEGCVQCTNNTDCQTCAGDYFLYTVQGVDICVPCSDFGCQNCTAYNNCTSCIDGYYESNTSCLSCAPCSLCDSPQNCTQCSPGYYLFNASCQPCNASCLTCQSSQTCSSCIEGYYLSDAVCQLCSAACRTCAQTADRCTSCSEGYYLSGQSCLACEQYCGVCRSAVKCDTCYFQEVNGTCCSQNCVICQPISSLFSNCSLCLSGFYLNQTLSQLNSTNQTTFICLPCSNYCINCSSATNCTACQPQYYLSNQLCLSCNAAISLCVECQNGSVCTNCGDGYLSDGVCFCHTSQYVNAQNCVDCPSECLTCANQTFCMACRQNYVLSGSSCVTQPPASFPWWGILLIVVVLILVVLAAAIWYMNWKKGKDLQTAYRLIGHPDQDQASMRRRALQIQLA